MGKKKKIRKALKVIQAKAFCDLHIKIDGCKCDIEGDCNDGAIIVLISSLMASLMTKVSRKDGDMIVGMLDELTASMMYENMEQIEKGKE